MAKHVAHHKHVAVFIVHADSVHPQELGQQRVTMALHNVLVEERKEWKEIEQQIYKQLREGHSHTIIPD